MFNPQSEPFKTSGNIHSNRFGDRITNYFGADAAFAASALYIDPAFYRFFLSLLRSEDLEGRVFFRS